MYGSPMRLATRSLEQSPITTKLRRSSQLAARLAFGVSLATLGTAAIAAPIATVDRNGSLVSVEAYAPNIVRVTIATDRGQVDAPPGDGPNAKPNATGWTHQTSNSADMFTSAALSVSVDAKPWPKAPSQMERYFAPSLPPVSVTIRKPDVRC